MSKCDFCRAELTPPVWDYPCHDFHFEVLAIVPDTDEHQVHQIDFYGAWAACETCHNMIESGDPDFYSHMAKSLAALRGKEEHNSLDLDLVTAINVAFTEHRTGPPVPSMP